LEDEVLGLKAVEGRFREQESELAKMRNFKEHYREQEHELADLRNAKERFEKQAMEIAKLREAQERSRAQERELMDMKKYLEDQVQENLKVLQTRQERFDAQENELRELRSKLGKLEILEQRDIQYQAQEKVKRERISSMVDKEQTLQAQELELVELRRIRDTQSQILNVQRSELQSLRHEVRKLSSQQDMPISDKTLVALPSDSTMRCANADIEYCGTFTPDARTEKAIDLALQINGAIPVVFENGGISSGASPRRRTLTREEYESLNRQSRHMSV